MNQPSLLNETDKYSFDVNDFPLTLDRFIFSAIYNLYTNGANKICALDVKTLLDDNLIAKNLIEKENGFSFLQDCEMNSTLENFYYYYNRLKKISLIRDLEKSGYPVSNVYSENPLDEDYTKINAEFDKLTSTDIINMLKGEIAVKEKRYVLNSSCKEFSAAEGIRDLVKSFKEKPEIGCELQGHIFNSITRGGRKGKLYLRSGGSGTGKAIPDYTLIPTPKGMKRVDEIKIGDSLFDRTGKPTKVLNVFPQTEEKEIFEVKFKDGRIAECCEDHLWEYYYDSHSQKRNRVETTRQIMDRVKGLKNNFKNSKNTGFRFFTRLNQAVSFEEKKLPLEPYVMGLILGDGSLRYTESQKGFSFSTNDEELLSPIEKELNCKKRKSSKYNYSWTFHFIEKKGISEQRKNIWVEEVLKDFPELWNLKSENKFIPECYLFGSIEQRKAILSGLLDTDGSIDSGGRVSFSSVSKKLINNLEFICRSLGYITSITLDDKRPEKYTNGVAYQLNIQCKKEEKESLFRLKRKKQIAIEYINNGKRAEKKEFNPIVSIQPTGKYTKMTCFTVDNDECLFLMNDFIVTHNTRTMVGDACNIAYPFRYDTRKNRWVATGNSEKVLYVMTEQDPEEIKTMILAYLTGYNEEIFIYGTYTEEEFKRIEVAIDIMERYEGNMKLAQVPDPCSSVIKNLFRRYVLQENVSNIFYDYIFSSPAMLAEYRDLCIREDVALRLLATTIKNLAVELDAFILTSTQVSNDDDPKGGFKDFHNVQGSRAIPNLVDFACIMSRPTKDELMSLGKLVEGYGSLPNVVYDVYKNRRGRWNMVRIWGYSDLGTCRRNDWFVTDTRGKPLKDFSIFNFTNLEKENYDELLALYNTGEVKDESVVQKYKVDQSIKEELLLDLNIKDAFGDNKRYEDNDFSDFL